MSENKAEENKKIEEEIETLIRNNTEIFPENLDDCSEKLKIDYDITMYAVKKVILELMERQNLDISEVKFLDSGAYSNVFKVGEFVVKLGFSRENRGVPYSKHIIRPLIAFKLMMGAYLEVQNLVDAKWYEGLSDEEIEEELFNLYVKLRKDGIIWKDIKKENVGRLLKRNSSNFEIDYIDKDGNQDSYEMNVSDDRLDVRERREDENEILPAGELVIIDRDYLMGRGAWTTKDPTVEKGREFSKRYESMEK